MSQRTEGCSTVVVIEDHTVIRRYVTDLLTEAGYDVVAAVDTCVGGSEIVRWWDPDIVVVDNRLPDGSGIDLACQLREERPATIVVVHAGVISEAESERMRAAGVLVVFKSLRPRRMISAVLQCTRFVPSTPV